MKSLKVFWLTLAAFVFLSGSVHAAQMREVRMAAGKEGSNIYASMVGIAAVANKVLAPKGIKIVPKATPGSTASIRMMNRGEIDFAYASTGDLADAYAGKGAFAKGATLKVLPLQGLYYANINIVPCVKPSSSITSFSDMAGKKFYPFDAASSVFQLYKIIFTELGTWDSMDIRQVQGMEAADALTMGTLDVIGAHASSNGLAAVAWVRNLDAASEIRFVQPTEEEIAKLATIPNITLKYIDNKWISEKNRAFNPEKIWTATVHYAFYPSADLPEDVTYEVCKALLENSADMVDITAMMKAFHNSGDPLEWTRVGIAEAVDIPVHPGYARYLKERGIWDNAWKEAPAKK